MAHRVCCRLPGSPSATRTAFLSSTTVLAIEGNVALAAHAETAQEVRQEIVEHGVWRNQFKPPSARCTRIPKRSSAHTSSEYVSSCSELVGSNAHRSGRDRDRSPSSAPDIGLRRLEIISPEHLSQRNRQEHIAP